MKLQRQSASCDLVPDNRGVKHCYYIMGKPEEAALIEKAEELLCMEVHWVNCEGKKITWNRSCDDCPMYNEGMSSGFMIDIDDVPDFKDTWKKIKKIVTQPGYDLTLLPWTPTKYAPE